MGALPAIKRWNWFQRSDWRSRSRRNRRSRREPKKMRGCGAVGTRGFLLADDRTNQGGHSQRESGYPAICPFTPIVS